MESARSVRNLLKVNIFTLNTKKEIISKITREVLSLFKVEITGRRGEADYVQLSVVNHRLPVLEQDEAAALEVIFTGHKDTIDLIEVVIDDADAPEHIAVMAGMGLPMITATLAKATAIRSWVKR